MVSDTLTVDVILVEPDATKGEDAVTLTSILSSCYYTPPAHGTNVASIEGYSKRPLAVSGICVCQCLTDVGE
jgi:hypothetical protein